MRMMPAVFGIVSRDSITGGPRCYNAPVTDGVPVRLTGWALILGASSGFGEATSLALARAGMNIFGVHLDRKATLANAERILAAVRALGDRNSTRLNSSHLVISYAVFCLKKKTNP